MSCDRQPICDGDTTATGNSSAATPTTEYSGDSGEETRTADGSPPAKKHRANGDDDPSCSAGATGCAILPCNTSPNTEVSTRWALTNFNLWRDNRNARVRGDSENQVPADLLKSTDSKLLNKWLSLYAAETQKQDGGVYPPKTVSQLLAGLARYMRSLNPACPNILDFKNEFKPLHDFLESIFRKRLADTSTPEGRPSKGLSKGEEDRLWSSGALSTETPKGLLRAVFFLNGKNFGIVGREKHRELKISDLKRVVNPPRYVYTKSVMKAHATLLPETVYIEAVAERGNRCHVHVLDLYLQKLPPEAFENDIFYLQPIAPFKDPARPWFTTNPVGKNSLNKMIKEIREDAGIDDQCRRASEHEATDIPYTLPAWRTPLQPPQVGMIPHVQSLVTQALSVARAREQRNTTHQTARVTLSQTTTNRQQQPVVYSTHPTHNTPHTNTAQEPTVSQSSPTTTNSPQSTTLSVQGGAPHNFTFHNCSVTIFVTPLHPQRESSV